MVKTCICINATIKTWNEVKSGRKKKEKKVLHVFYGNVEAIFILFGLLVFFSRLDLIDLHFLTYKQTNKQKLHIHTRVIQYYYITKVKSQTTKFFGWCIFDVVWASKTKETNNRTQKKNGKTKWLIYKALIHRNSKVCWLTFRKWTKTKRKFSQSIVNYTIALWTHETISYLTFVSDQSINAARKQSNLWTTFVRRALRKPCHSVRVCDLVCGKCCGCDWIKCCPTSEHRP